jgi:hypothetical protein
MQLNKLILVGLCILNLAALGSGEIQRRALVQHSVDMQAAAFAKIESADKLLLSRADQILALSQALADRAKDSPKTADAVRAFRVATLRDALIRYRADNKNFPQVATGPVSSLAPALLGKYIESIPEDPSGLPMLYTVDGATSGDRFGIRVTLEDKTVCITGYGATLGWWGDLPKCPF